MTYTKSTIDQTARETANYQNTIDTFGVVQTISVGTKSDWSYCAEFHLRPIEESELEKYLPTLEAKALAAIAAERATRERHGDTYAASTPTETLEVVRVEHDNYGRIAWIDFAENLSPARY